MTPAFIVQMYSRFPEGSPRCGITASRKVGGAVKRNRAKRRLRSLARMVMPQWAHRGTDYVLIAREEVLKREFSAMVQELEHALKKVHQQK